MLDALPHDRIREARDRGWTVPLLERVTRTPAPEPAELEAAFETLAELGDPRAVAPLRTLLEDRGASSEVRLMASEVLDSLDDTTPAERLAWWRSGDAVLMEHALTWMEGSGEEGPIVAAVAADDDHPLQAAALRSMSHSFERPEFHAILVQALRHPDPEVRHAAARTLFWDQPLAAQEALLTAVEDEDDDVAEGAADALEYYENRTVLQALDALSVLTSGDAEDQVRASRDSIRESFQVALGTVRPGAESERLWRWMQPVSEFVEPPATGAAVEAADAPPTPVLGVRLPAPLPEPELRALLADPDGAWAPKLDALGEQDWSVYSAQERERMTTQLVAHPDRGVRRRATPALRVWRAYDALLVLARDPARAVCWSAIEALKELEPDPRAAAAAWELVEGSYGWLATDALATYAVHAPPAEAKARLAGVARDPARPELRRAAIVALRRLKAADAIAELAPLLFEPPVVTWSVHVWLLDAMVELGVPAPDLRHLEEVDDLWLQVSIAAAIAQRDPRLESVMG